MLAQVHVEPRCRGGDAKDCMMFVIWLRGLAATFTEQVFNHCGDFDDRAAAEQTTLSLVYVGLAKA
jgi:hypothetical protein